MGAITLFVVMIDAIAGALLPYVMRWAQTQEGIILRDGVPLSAEQSKIARLVGVQMPDKVRVLGVDMIPLPLPLALHRLAQRLGLVSSCVAGMTLQSGIYLRADCCSNKRLLAHELAHVAQYERLGGFRAFLHQYLRECIAPGYPRGALEREARHAETLLQQG
jgi:hypothetical protein